MKNREQLPRPVRLIKPGDPDFSIVKKPEPIPMEEVKEIDSSGEIQQGHNKFYRDRRLSEEEIKKNLQRRVIEEQEYQKRQLSEQEAKELGEKSEKFLYDTCQRLLTVLVTTYPKFYLTDKNDPEERSYCYKTGTHHSRRGLMDLEDKKGIDVGLQLACRIEDQETYGLIQYDAKSRWKNVGNFRRKGKKMGLEERSSDSLRIRRAILSNPEKISGKQLAKEILKDIEKLGLVPLEYIRAEVSRQFI